MKADQTSSQGQHVSATLTHSVRYLQAQLNEVTHQKLSWVNWEGGQTTFYSSWEDWNYRRFQGPLLFLILVQRELSFRRLRCRAPYHSENSLRKLAKPKPPGCSLNLHLMCFHSCDFATWMAFCLLSWDNTAPSNSHWLSHFPFLRPSGPASAATHISAKQPLLRLLLLYLAPLTAKRSPVITS